jgi:hypothetical protein
VDSAEAPEFAELARAHDVAGEPRHRVAEIVEADLRRLGTKPAQAGFGWSWRRFPIAEINSWASVGGNPIPSS